MATPSAATALIEAAKAAATKELDAVYLSPISKDACDQNNQAKKVCIEFNSPAQDALTGVVKFLAGFPSPVVGPGTPPTAGSGVAIYYARMQDGSWHYWFASQQGPVYRIVQFPANAFVCAGGTGLNVREQPSTTANVVTLLKALATMRTEEFVLSQPGVWRGKGNEDDGWYRISSPVQGWVNYRYVSDASRKTCADHDAMEHVP